MKSYVIKNDTNKALRYAQKIYSFEHAEDATVVEFYMREEAQNFIDEHKKICINARIELKS